MPIRCRRVFRSGDNHFCFDDKMTQPDYLVRAGALTGFRDLVRSVGGDPQPLLKALDLAPDLLDDPEAKLPLERVGCLLDRAARALAMPDFGMRLAQYQDLSVVGSIAVIALHSRDFGAAMRSLARYWSYHTPGGVLEVIEETREPAHVEIRYEISIADDEARRQALELSFAVMLRFLRLYVPAAIAQTCVTFRHAQSLDGRIYRRHFRCPTRFEQDFNALTLPLRFAHVPLSRTANEELRAAAERYVSSVVRRFPLDIGNQVRALAEQQLAYGAADIGRIAAQLNFHPRTLQRRLAEQGLSFYELVDELRRDRAQELLCQHAIPLSRIGDLLGYTRQSTFIQACHRWFGMPPGAIRTARSRLRPVRSV
jgi:AraC-like DNA-binding protein